MNNCSFTECVECPILVESRVTYSISVLEPGTSFYILSAKLRLVLFRILKIW